MMPTQRLLPLLSIVTLALLLSACGFQLRQSAPMPASFGPVAISGTDEFSTFHQVIRRNLRQLDIPLASQGSSANHRIKVRLKSKRRVLSVGGSGKVSEYELTKTLNFNVLDAAGNEVIESQTLSASKAYTVDRNDVLGDTIEEDDVKLRLEEDLVDRMFRFISRQI